MKTAIYFLRHGQVHNPRNILYGRLPGFPLSDNGRRQIEKIARKFKDKSISQIYTSPILRARQTAEIIGKNLKIKPQVSRLITETDDILQGMPLTQFREEIEPKLYNPKFISRGQESVESQLMRMLKFIKLLKQRHLGKNILVVSHGDPIMIVKAKIEGIPFNYRYKKKHYLKTGQYFKLDIEDNKYKFI